MRLIPVLAILLVLAGAAIAEEGGASGKPKPPQGMPKRPPSPVRVAPVQARAVEAARSFVGTVEASRAAMVGSEFDGLVVEYLIREGDHVEAGQPLARLRTNLLDIRIRAAEATLKLRETELEELVNGYRPEEIRQARARVKQLEAELEFRKWRRENNERLYKDRTISEDELRDARLAEIAAERLLDSGKAALDLLEAGPREEKIEQARSQISIQQAEVARLEEERSRYEINAPFSGWVVKELTEVGQWLSTGAPVAEILHLEEVDVVVQVVEDFVGQVSVGEEVRIHLDAVPDRIFVGAVHKVVPQGDLRGRTFPVRIRLKNERTKRGPLLMAGMFATATLSVGQEEQGLFVPKDAIVLGGKQIVVWMVDTQKGIAMPVPVTLGVAVDDLVQVRGPLEPGTPVVIRGNERIFMPGSPVQILD